MKNLDLTLADACQHNLERVLFQIRQSEKGVADHALIIIVLFFFKKVSK